MIIDKIRHKIDRIIYKYGSFGQREKILKKQGVKIGKNSQVYSDVSFGSEPYLISLGDNVRITSGVKFVTHDGGVWVIRNKMNLVDIDLFGKIEIGNNVHIGLGTIIMPNVKIGNNVIIGCGAVVTKDIPNNSIAVGVPARVIKTIDEYHENHQSQYYHTKSMNSNEKRKYIEEHINMRS